eukprot:TRINITY_DN48416_c0_g1_i1.p1 TRINITY_DN48416_c0_g1~~TRINITY_DN48416_c0_g1_i1.p1  ORF type:complete len:561 (-),score=98.86 TRINITY_DN48416_c0_g1_i1:192-1874(-)
MSRRTQNASAPKQQQASERREIFAKTKMCKFFMVGACTQGDNCRFAHDDVELSGTPDLNGTKVCKQLIKKGVCKDPKCTYAHSKEELRLVPGFNDDPETVAKLMKTLATAQQGKAGVDGSEAGNRNAGGKSKTGKKQDPKADAQQLQSKTAKAQARKLQQIQAHQDEAYQQQLQQHVNHQRQLQAQVNEVSNFYGFQGNNASTSSAWPMGGGFFPTDGQAAYVNERSNQPAPWYFSNRSFCDSEYSQDRIAEYVDERYISDSSKDSSGHRSPSRINGGEAGSTLAWALSRFRLGSSRGSSASSNRRSGEYMDMDSVSGSELPLSIATAHRLNTLGGFKVTGRKIEEAPSAPQSEKREGLPPGPSAEPVRIEASSLKSMSLHSMSVPASVAASDDGEARVSTINNNLIPSPLTANLKVKNTFLSFDDLDQEIPFLRKVSSEGQLGVQPLATHELDDFPTGDLDLDRSSQALPSTWLWSNGGRLDLVPEHRHIFGRQFSVESGVSDLTLGQVEAAVRQITAESNTSETSMNEKAPQGYPSADINDSCVGVGARMAKVKTTES